VVLSPANFYHYRPSVNGLECSTGGAKSLADEDFRDFHAWQRVGSAL
jgi:hypothetical protein